MTSDQLRDAIVKFEASKKEYQDYLDFIIVVGKAFKMGIGLGGYEIEMAIKEAIDLMKGK